MTTLPEVLTIATRGSQLALWQAQHVKRALQTRYPALQVRLEVLTTTGDRVLETSLAKIGGKGLFVKEIEQALIDGRADLAVHSMKDLPPVLADGLRLSATSIGESPWDALCARAPVTLATLPRGAKVGTSSVRRQSQLLAVRPDLEIAFLRGNVPTRLAKLDNGDYDAIVLAHAGLLRLGLGARATEVLPAAVCLPAVAQGVLAIETRATDEVSHALVREVMHDDMSEFRTMSERAFSAALGGNCHTPLAAHAVVEAGQLTLTALVASLDGQTRITCIEAGPCAEAVAIGQRAAARLMAQGAAVLLHEA